MRQFRVTTRLQMKMDHECTNNFKKLSKMGTSGLETLLASLIASIWLIGHCSTVNCHMQRDELRRAVFEKSSDPLILGEDNRHLTAVSDPSQMMLPAVEMGSLQDLYVSTGGQSWTWFGTGKQWSFNSNSNPCYDKWEGIICSCNPIKATTVFRNNYYAYYDDDISALNGTLTCNVIKLFLNRHNLRGKIPWSIGNLTRLTHLHMDANGLTGTVPDSLFALHSLNQSISSTATNAHSLVFNNLTLISLLFNELSGTLSPLVSNLRHLRVLFLSGNRLTGTIPATLAHCSGLELFGLFNNTFSRTIPEALYQISSIMSFDVANNLMTGTISSKIANWRSIFFLAMGFNSFSSTIPNEMYQLTDLAALYLGYNPYLPSTLPTEIGYLTNLIVLYLDSSNLYGKIPSEMSKCTKLNILQIYNNHFSGPLPNFVFGLSNLTTLDFSSNDLSGTISQSIATLTNLKQFIIADNILSGSLPPSIGSLLQLEVLRVSSNRIQGAIPSSLFDPIISESSGISYRPLTVLGLGDNFLQGSIPTNIAMARNLQILSAYSNQLTGVIPVGLFSISTLSILALSENCLSIESISASICGSTQLTSLLLDGLRSASSCRGQSLLSLPAFGYDSNTYSLSSGINKNDKPLVVLPSCLLSMPNLQSLHVSGNGLLGNLNELLSKETLSPNLTDLAISHNYISGHLPLQIQMRSSWQVLDLSFNQLGGTLVSEMSLQPQSTLRLNVNLLSGTVPVGLLNLESIAILEGNKFGCSLSLNDNELPIHDDYISKVVCGSNDFDTSIIIWGVVGVVAFVILGGIVVIDTWRNESACHSQVNVVDVRRVKRDHYSLLTYAKELIVRTATVIGYVHLARQLQVPSFPQHVDILPEVRKHTDNIMKQFEHTLACLCWGMMWITFASCLAMVVYGGFSDNTNYSTIDFQYAYLVSAAFVSGILPGVLYAGTFTILIVVCYRIYIGSLDIVINANERIKIHFLKSVIRKSAIDSFRRSVSSYIKSVQSCKLQSMVGFICKRSNANYAKLVFVLLINCVIVMVVNGAFVSAYLILSNRILVVISILLSIFKLVWTSYAVPRLVSLLSNQREANIALNASNIVGGNTKKALSFKVVIVILNTIIIPCLAVIFVSPECLFYAVSQPPLVQTSFQLTFCVQYILDITSTGFVIGDCIIPSAQTQQLHYAPPFIYGNRCSAALLSSYSSVYVFVFVFSGFVGPTLTLLIAWIIHHLQPELRMFNLLADGLPQHHLPVDQLGRKKFCLTIFTHQTDSVEQNPSSKANEFFGVELTGAVTAFEGEVSLDSMKDASVIGAIRKLNIEDQPQQKLEIAPEQILSSSQIETIFNSQRFVLQLAQNLSIMLSFGIIFPPLAVLGFVSVIMQTLTTHYAIRKTMINVMTLGVNQSHWKVIIDECEVVVILLRRCMWSCFPASFLVQSIFLFDIVGSLFPAKEIFAVILPVVFVGFGLCSFYFATIIEFKHLRFLRTFLPSMGFAPSHESERWHSSWMKPSLARLSAKE